MLSKVFGVFFLKALAALFSFLLNIVIINSIGEESAGYFFYMQSVILFLSSLFIFGLQGPIVRETAKLHSNNRLGEVLGFSIKFNVSIFFVAFLALLFYSGGLALKINNSLNLQLCLIGSFLYAVNSVFFSFNQGVGNFKTSVLFQTLFFNFVVVAYTYFLSSDLSEIVYVYLFSILAAVAVQIFNPNLLKCIKKSVFYQRIEYKYILFMGLPCLMIIGSERFVIVFIQYLIESNLPPENISYFTVIIRITGMVTIIVSTLNVIMSREISILYSEKNIFGMQSLATKSFRVLFFMALLFFAIILIFGKTILSIFSEEFTQYHKELIVVAIGQSINVLTGSSSYFLMMTGNEIRLAKSISAGLIFSFMYALFKYQSFNLVDAVICYSIYLSLSNLTSWYYTKRLIGINTMAFRCVEK